MEENTAWPRESTIEHNKLEATTAAYIKEFLEFLIFCLEIEKLSGSPVEVVTLLQSRWSLSTYSLAEFTRLGHAKSRKQTDYKLHINWDKKATYQPATSFCAMLRFILRRCCHFIKN